jgi:hypothetical protein
MRQEDEAGCLQTPSFSETQEAYIFRCVAIPYGLSKEMLLLKGRSLRLARWFNRSPKSLRRRRGLTIH